jgi:hypothetical protein
VKHLTIRNLPSDLGEALEREKKRRGKSLNQTVIELLSQGVGVGPGNIRTNGLRVMAGTWTEEEHARFEEAITPTEQVDEELWG